MNNTFFKLTNSFAIEETKGLSAAEIRIMLFIKTLNPFGDRPLVLSIEKIAQKLEINKSTVSRALKKLKELGKITVEIIRKVTISTPMQNGNAGCKTETKDAKSQSSVQNGNNRWTNPAPSKQSGVFQTYTDFINTLSEAEREKFFNFVREKTKDFNPKIASLTDYLRSQSRYLELYSEFRRVVPAEERNFRISDWKNQPEWTGILASIKRAGVAFIGIGGIDRKYADIPQPIRKKLVEYVRNNPENS